MHDLKLIILFWDSEYVFFHAVPDIACYAMEPSLRLPQEWFIPLEALGLVSHIQFTAESNVTVLSIQDYFCYQQLNCC